MHRIRIITLDLDDTLWAIRPVIERAERELWAWLCQHYPRIERHWDDDSMLALRRQVASEYDNRAHDLCFLRRTVLARMAETAGYDRGLVDPAFRIFDNARNRVQLFPDVLPALEQLGRDYTVVALTNGNASLEAIGIRRFFHGVVTAVDAGAAKPHARIFTTVLRRTGASPREVLHVGDQPELDIAGAQAAGLHSAWVNREAAAWPADLLPPDTEVASMAELAAWLRQATAAHAD